MIFTNRTIKVNKGKSTIDEPVILYRGDYEVELRFIIMETKFRFKSGVNLVDSEKASHAQLALLAPDGANVFTEVGRCEDGTAIFTLSKEMIDELSEVGLYSFQIRLFDYYRESRVSIPPVEFGIEVREPIAAEDHTNAVDDAMVGYSIAKTSVLDEPVPETFDDNGQYNKTDWETGDRISEGKLNKIEDAIDTVNKNNIDSDANLNKKINSNFNVLQSKMDGIDSHFPIQLKDLHTEVKTAMTGGSVAVVGEDMVGSENLKELSVEERHLKDSVITNRTMTPNSVTTENLFVPKVSADPTYMNMHKSNTTTANAFVEYNKGTIAYSSEYACTDFITVSGLDEITVCCDGPLAFCMWYDGMKNYIGYTAGAGTPRIVDTVVDIPEDAVYVRINIDTRLIKVTNFTVFAKTSGYKVIGESFIADDSIVGEQLKTNIIKSSHLSAGCITSGHLSTYAVTGNALSNKILTSRNFNSNLFMSKPNIYYPLPGNITYGVEASCKSEGKETFAYVTIVLDNAFRTGGGTYKISGQLDMHNDTLNTTIHLRTFRGTTTDPRKYDGIAGIIHASEEVMVKGKSNFTLSAEIPKGADYPYLKIVVAIANVKPKALSDLKATISNLDITINDITVLPDDIIDVGFMQEAYSEGRVFLGTSDEPIINEPLSIVREVDLNNAIQDHLNVYHQGGILPGVSTSQWAGKKILAIGDSITDPDTPEDKYIEFITSDIGCSLTNNGISGSGFINGTSLVGRIDSLGNDYDLIYVFLGTNDYGNNGGVPLGAWGSTSTNDFYGAVDYCFGKLVEKYPLKTIAILTPLPRRNGWDPNSKGHTMDDYCEAIRKTAEKYSFPLLDLHKHSGFLANSATFNANYCYGGNGVSGGDGLHPNTAWHRDFLARKVLSFFETL